MLVSVVSFRREERCSGIILRRLSQISPSLVLVTVSSSRMQLSTSGLMISSLTNLSAAATRSMVA